LKKIITCIAIIIPVSGLIAMGYWSLTFWLYIHFPAWEIIRYSSFNRFIYFFSWRYLTICPITAVISIIILLVKKYKSMRIAILLNIVCFLTCFVFIAKTA
jgi:hypothetical protein